MKKKEKKKRKNKKKKRENRKKRKFFFFFFINYIKLGKIWEIEWKQKKEKTTKIGTLQIRFLFKFAQPLSGEGM